MIRCWVMFGILIAAMLAAFSLMSVTTSQAAHLHSEPLPILQGNYGNAEGCLVIHGDQPEGPALWLTQQEVGWGDFQCLIQTWEHHANGTLSFRCGPRKYVVLPQLYEEGLKVIELQGQKASSTYALKQCGPE
jgi:hypothetical protein